MSDEAKEINKKEQEDSTNFMVYDERSFPSDFLRSMTIELSRDENNHIRCKVTRDGHKIEMEGDDGYDDISEMQEIESGLLSVIFQRLDEVKK